MDSGKDIREAVMRYSDMLYKVCLRRRCRRRAASARRKR